MSNSSPPNFRAPRACIKCGYVRVVLVRTKTRYIPGGPDAEIVHGARIGTFVLDGENFEDYCTACHYEMNAKKYDRLADLNRKRAAVARSKQAIARLKHDDPTRKP